MKELIIMDKHSWAKKVCFNSNKLQQWDQARSFQVDFVSLYDILSPHIWGGHLAQVEHQVEGKRPETFLGFRACFEGDKF
jgi:hypothetical protein